MTCSYCGSRTREGENRCWRCGRRPGDSLNAAITHGALAAQPQPTPYAPVLEPPKPVRVAPAPLAVPNFSRAQQGSLFPDRQGSNVVPIKVCTPGRAVASPPASRSNAMEYNGKPAAKQQRRAPRVDEAQGSLFLPPAPSGPRKLGTTVEAVIFCEAPVAIPLHRAVAGAFDWAMVLIGYGLFLLAFHLNGGEFAWNKVNFTVFAGMLLLIAFTYGIFWAIAGRDTAGMRFAHLRLVTFDGFPPERKQRLARFASSCLSVTTVLGLLWLLADEECLGWHDYISHTFPTPRGLDTQVFHRR